MEEELCQEDKELCPSAGELALTGLLSLVVGGVGGDTQLEGGGIVVNCVIAKEKIRQPTLEFANGVACLDLARVDPRVEISKVGAAFQEGSENLEHSCK